MAQDRKKGHSHSRPKVDDLMRDQKKLAYIIKKIAAKISSEIGHPMYSFDYIVGVESMSKGRSCTNIG